jgi:hypothetical protein
MIFCQKFAQAAKTFNRVEIFFNQELLSGLLRLRGEFLGRLEDENDSTGLS